MSDHSAVNLVIFDLDDTLIDFATTRQVAYTQLGQHLDLEGIDSAAYLHACAACDRPLFVQFEQGLLTRAQYRLRRFADPFTELGIAPRDALIEELNKIFMDCVNDSPKLYEDAWPTLERLRAQGLRLAILTNGPSDGQRRKLQATGLEQMVDTVTIGEEIGFSKPSPHAFHSVLKRFDAHGAETLMIGDSPQLDYDAALQAGLQAVLLDRAGQHRDSGRAAVESLHAVLLQAGG
ncbi:MAG TPA: HAD family hydrolase [Ideonella sp.]|uniref:HAD family hydrolase n=1 Tax=Ideonella sp. TaxID=1929293 RepID=UPI002E381488|nr:HAD family hydrolase [Ideonella sp.]HEX5685857.1 HAD family hydrolase [Ideonella sp.]